MDWMDRWIDEKWGEGEERKGQGIGIGNGNCIASKTLSFAFSKFSLFSLFEASSSRVL